MCCAQEYKAVDAGDFSRDDGKWSAKLRAKGYTAVLAEAKDIALLNYDETVVYESEQAIPSHIVIYEDSTGT